MNSDAGSGRGWVRARRFALTGMLVVAIDLYTSKLLFHGAEHKPGRPAIAPVARVLTPLGLNPWREPPLGHLRVGARVYSAPHAHAPGLSRRRSGTP
jgi:hypothetical protein